MTHLKEQANYNCAILGAGNHPSIILLDVGIRKLGVRQGRDRPCIESIHVADEAAHATVSTRTSVWLL